MKAIAMNRLTRSLVQLFVILLLGAFVLTGCSKDPVQLFESAKQREAKGDRVGAIIDMKAALQKHPDNGEMRFMLGRLYNDTFDAASAEKELMRAKELGVVEGGRVSVQLAYALRAQGKLKELLAEVQPATAFEPAAQAAIHALRGRAHLGLGQRDEARRSLAAGANVVKDAADVIVLDVILKASDRQLDEALTTVDALLGADSKHFEGWRLKAQLLATQGKEAETLTVYGKLLELHPVYFGALVGRSALLMKLGRLDEAQKDVQLLIKVYKQHPQAHVQHAQLLLVRGQAREALEAVQVALKVEPPPSNAVLLAGLIHQAEGSMQQAESFLNKYVAQHPNDPFGRFALASVLVKSKKAERALELISPILASDFTHQKVLILAGDAHAALGNAAKALELYEKAVAIDPQDPEGRLKQAMLRFQSGDFDKGTVDLETALSLTKQVTLADEVLVLTQISRGKHDDAMVAAQKMLDKMPTSALAHNMMGAVWLAKKEPAKAKLAFEMALKNQPTFFPAARNLARISLQQGDTQSARNQLEQFVRKDPKSASAYLELARIGPRVKATNQEVENWLAAAISADPKNVEAVVLLVDEYLRHGEPNKALELADKALVRIPGESRLTALAARAQFAAGEKQRAITTLERAASENPQSAASLVRLATAQLANNRSIDAAVTLRKALALEPALVSAQLMLAECELRLNRSAEALKIAAALRKQNPKSATGWILEGDVHAREKKLAQAVNAYEHAMQLDKSAAAVTKLYGALSLDGRSREGIRRLETWMKQQPNDLATRLFLAQVHRNDGNHNLAIEHYERIIEARPNDVVALNNVAWSYGEIGDKRAVPMAERALKLSPKSAAIKNTLGWVLIGQGERERGVALLKEAAALEPKSASIRFYYAQGLLRAGDKRAAKAELERLLVDFPGFSDQTKARQLLAGLGS